MYTLPVCMVREHVSINQFIQDAISVLILALYSNLLNVSYLEKYLFSLYL